MSQKQTGFHCCLCAQSLSADFDLDHCANNMILARDTLSCHDNYLCLIYLKSLDVKQIIGLSHFTSLCTKFMSPV